MWAIKLAFKRMEFIVVVFVVIPVLLILSFVYVVISVCEGAYEGAKDGVDEIGNEFRNTPNTLKARWPRYTGKDAMDELKKI